MLPYHNLWDLEEQGGRGFINLSYAEGREKDTNINVYDGEP